MKHPPEARLSERTRSWLHRCKALALRMEGAQIAGRGKRLRIDGGGRPPALELEYGLFNWYLDYYMACSARIWPSTLRRAGEVRPARA
jgi:hypothetical protein